MSFQISSNSADRGKDNDHVIEYHGVIVSYNYVAKSGVIEFLDDSGIGVVRRRARFRREYVLVGTSYTLNVGEEVKFNKDRESSHVKLKNIIPVSIEDKVREDLSKKALEAMVLVSERLAKLRTKK